MPQTSALFPPNDQPCRISIPKCKRIENRTLLALKLRIGNGGQKTTSGHNYFFVAADRPRFPVPADIKPTEAAPSIAIFDGRLPRMTAATDLAFVTLRDVRARF